MTDKVLKRKLCQLILVILCSLFWIPSTVMLGPIDCPEMSVQNYHSALCYISEEFRSHMVWWCRPWFSSTWSRSDWSSLVQTDSVLHTWI